MGADELNPQEEWEAAAHDLAELLCLPTVGLGIDGARVVGRGSQASVDLYLSDLSTVASDSVRDFANSTRLAVEIAACTGATPEAEGTSGFTSGRPPPEGRDP